MPKNQYLNQADEEKKIEFVVFQCRKKLFELNKSLKYYKITDIEITKSETVMAPITTHWQVFKRIKEFIKS